MSSRPDSKELAGEEQDGGEDEDEKIWAAWTFDWFIAFRLSSQLASQYSNH